MSTRTTQADVEQALNAVDSTQEIETRSLKENQELVDFINQNEIDLREIDGGDLVDIAALYGGSYQTYRSSLEEYLRSFKLMLEFERDNFSAISRGKQREKYQKLYNNYTKAAEKQNNAYRDYLAVMNKFGERHPRLKKTLSETLSNSQRGFNSQP